MDNCLTSSTENSLVCVWLGRFLVSIDRVLVCLLPVCCKFGVLVIVFLDDGLVRVVLCVGFLSQSIGCYEFTIRTLESLCN